MASPATIARMKLLACGYSPIPLVGKVPVGKDWQHKRSTNSAEIELWEKVYPTATNTGILTEHNSVFDSDITYPDAAYALRDYVCDQLIERGAVLVRVGKSPKWAIVLRCQTPFPKMTRNLVAPNGSAEKLEVLCAGQQVVADGIHPDTGKPYVWPGGKSLLDVPSSELPLVTAQQMAELLDGSVRLLCDEYGYTIKQAPRPSAGNGHAPPGSDWGDLVGNVLAGAELHDSLAVLAAKLVKGGVPDGLAVNLIRAIAAHSTAPHDARYRDRVGDIHRAVATARAKYAPAPAQADDTYTLETFEGIAMKPIRYRVKGLLPANGLVVVWGPPKCGKSFWVFDLVMHVARGSPYRKHKVEACPIVYCAFEGMAGFAARVEAYRRHHEIKVAPFYLVAAVMDFIGDHSRLIDAIRGQAAIPPGIIVLDTLNRSLVGSENKDEDMGAYIHAADALREAFDCLVIIVHHCGVEGTRPRGHSSLTGAVDGQIAVKKDESGLIECRVEYMKDGAEGEVQLSRLKVVDLGKDNDGDTITSCVIESANDERTMEQRKQKLSEHASQHLRELHNCLAEVGVILSPNDIIPRNTKIVTVDQWRSRCYATSITDSEQPDTKRKAFGRAAKELQAMRVIGVWNDMVWVADRAGQYWHPAREKQEEF
jgi:AAA domain/Bifunctional DNA primase/polymerase, N-terminal